MEKVGKYEDKSIEVFLKNYKLGKILGVGSTAKVKAARHKLTGHQVAIKILNHRKIAKMGLEQKVRREIKIMKLFKHPHIVQLYEVIETPTDTYVVMEYVKSGELFDYIVEKGRLKEDEARRIFQQIICGVEHCHRNMIVHRDLKPENVLLDSNFNVKVADFGFSNVMYDGHFFKTSCGSPNYAAPEVISGKLYAGPEVDIWSCGVILYAILCGSLPFDNENILILRQKIKNGVYKLPSYLSAEARNLISSLLIVDPLRRITMPQIRQHPWFQAHLPRYLAVKPTSTLGQLEKIDEDVLQKVVMMGFSKDKLVESLHNKRQNEGTVTYYLLLGDRFPISSGYLGAEIQESTEPKQMNPIVGALPSFERMHNQVVAVAPQIPNNGKWALGLQAKAHPRDIMMKVLKVLQELNVCWKKIGEYNMKCKLTSDTITHHQDMPNHSIMLKVNHVTIFQNVVKFEVQLYKVQEERYLLDLQRIQGPQFLFLNLCATFISQLRVV
ncbi:SNF1-related protein kinase catalytic subunit alpha KIN10-like isoform X1 [Benincasa hispida]|uniref:SNF1-related protein kinase catalytic subunit alpha KIN10-like isoform X1 n=1 Tax=Benincasa hispida TaxID=102211 RepID=UPI0019007716|nr:SNF1-related protein kinase catalytic subunit alpha KIN10-like isoform X1 [Benincasa hispida]